MLRPFLRAGVLSAHDPNAIPVITDFTGAPQFSGTGTLSVTAHASQNGNNFAARPAFSGTGTLSVTAVKGGGGGGGGSVAVPYSANQIIESIGIDTHWTYSDYQSNASMLKAAIYDIGIRHIRDRISTGSAAVSNVQDLHNHGVTGSFILGAPWTGKGFITSVPAAISAAKSGYAGIIDKLEGPNEPDIFGGTGYDSTTHTWMNQMYPSVRGDSFFNSIPVSSPSFAKPGFSSGYGTDRMEDNINMHTYLSGQVPETSRLDSWITESYKVYGTKDLTVTEWGYHTDLHGASNWVDYPTQRDYTIRAILYFLQKKVISASLYELFDQAGASTAKEQHFGIIESNGTYKPVATALKNFIGRLKDTGTGSLITSYTFKWTSSGTDVEVMPIGRRDGAIDFAVWRKADVFNFSTGTDVTVSPVAVNFTIGSAKSAVAYRVNTGASTTLTSSSTTFTVQADGNVQLVRVS